MVDITPKEAKKIIEEHRDDPRFVLIDVRTPGEFAAGHLKDAINIDMLNPLGFKKLLSLDKDKVYVIYCRTGHRSGVVVSAMEKMGFPHVYNVVGGILRWLDEVGEEMVVR